MPVAAETAREVGPSKRSVGVRGRTGEDHVDDLDLSFSSAFSNIDNDDDISIGGFSINSNASSVHETITAATNRRRGRIQRIRDSFQRNSNIEPEPPSTIIDAVENVEIGSNPSLGQANGQDLNRCSSGIMTVRTLDESLHGADNHVTKMRRLRRKVTIKFKGASAEMRGSSSSRSARESATEDDVRDANQGNEDVSVITSQSASSTISTLDDITLGFHKVYIRDYEVVPGCNPAVSCGPPLELGWRHSEHREVDFERYESVRHGKRRSNHQMRMPKSVRKDLLLMHGSTKKMIKDASKQAKRPR